MNFAPYEKILRARPWLALLLIYAGMFLLHGFSESDIPDFLRIAHDATKIMEPENRQFLYSSPLNFILGDALHLPNIAGFYLIHSGEILLMLVLAAHCVQKKLGDNGQQLRFFIYLSLTPLWLITLKWIGKPDPLLIGMGFVSWGYMGWRRWLAVLLMVTTHREMGIFMSLFLFACEEKPDYTLIMPVLGGLGLHHLYEYRVLNHVPSSRVEDITIDILRHPKEFLRSPTFYVLASLGWYWLVVLWQRPPLRLGLVLLAAFGVAVISEDFTRDFTLMALFPVLFHLERVVKTPSSDVLMRFWPLVFLQIQIASMGVVWKTNNILVDWVSGNLGNQLLR